MSAVMMDIEVGGQTYNAEWRPEAGEAGTWEILVPSGPATDGRTIRIGGRLPSEPDELAAELAARVDAVLNPPPEPQA